MDSKLAVPNVDKGGGGPKIHNIPEVIEVSPLSRLVLLAEVK